MLDPYSFANNYGGSNGYQVVQDSHHIMARPHLMPPSPQQFAQPRQLSHHQSPAPHMMPRPVPQVPQPVQQHGPSNQQHINYQQRYQSFDAVSAGPPMTSAYSQPLRPQEMSFSHPQRNMCSPSAPSVVEAMNRYPPQPSPTPSTTAVFPRSASEALFDTTSKFRQLPCRTFISVGTCPYRERCVYLHDPRCICREAKTKTRRKNKEDVVLDALFWPVMPYPMVAAKLDANRQPHVIQPYSVPLPQSDHYRHHDTAVYSMWMHFVDFCLANSETSSAPHPDASACFSAPDVVVNSYTQQQRLNVFRVMSRSNGRSLTAQDLKQNAEALLAKLTEDASRVDSLDENDRGLSAMHSMAPTARAVDGKASSPVTVTTAFDISPMRHMQQPMVSAFGPSSYGTAMSEQQPVPPIFQSIWGQDSAALNKPASGSSESPTGVVDGGSPTAAAALKLKQPPQKIYASEDGFNGFSVDAFFSSF